MELLLDVMTILGILLEVQLYYSVSPCYQILLYPHCCIIVALPSLTPIPIPIPTQNPSTDTLTSTTIEWSVPGDSGADITSYTITYTSESGEGVESVDGSATSALLTGLTPNVDYEASITASNCAGTSEPTAFTFRIQGAGMRKKKGKRNTLILFFGLSAS